MEQFPINIPGWGNDKIISNLHVAVEDSDTGEVEDARLTAVLELRRGKTYRNSDGHKVMDIDIKKWNARGPSKLLGKNIEIVVKSGKDQPKSSVVSNQPESDFPATMTFNVVSDLYVDGDKVAENSEGQAVNKSMNSIPPLGEDVFSVEKKSADGAVIKYGKFNIVAVECLASLATLSSTQNLLFYIGHKLGYVSENVYKKTKFIR